ALIAGSISVFLTLWIGKLFSKFITLIDYRKLVVFVIFFIIMLCFFLTGPLGVFVLFISTSIGIIPAIIKTTRTHSMGCLLLPVILYFIL
ncbi:tripartite tricarboxylate transporter permease, partial [Candidatus Woesearchaeota archaeon]|nr:tripartite tricarboxylate transporter permease [Candidatus Woesearchaeota archaeon]